MLATATVTPAPVYTAADIASGLRALAMLIEEQPALIADGLRAPHAPQHISIGLADRGLVEAFAFALGSAVQQDDHGDHTYISTSALLDGLRVSAYAVRDRLRLLRRDPEATAILAERDA